MNNEYLIKKETMEAIANEVRDASARDYKQRPQDMLDSLKYVNDALKMQQTKMEGIVELIEDKADPDAIAGNYYPEVNDANGLTYTIRADGFSSATPLKEKDVCFYDYDGALLYSYTVDEIQAMTELPPLPYHKGLICQGWNWTLEDLQEEGSLMDVGAQYTTDDGKTRLYVSVYDLMGGTSTIALCMTKHAINHEDKDRILVDWGDGSEPDEFVGGGNIKVKLEHDYAVEGDYVIEISVIDCLISLGENSSDKFINANTALYKVEIGDNVINLATSAFNGCRCLSTITMPEAIDGVECWSFYYCAALAFFVMPKNAKFNDKANGVFSGCSNLRGISLSNSVTNVATNFITGPNKISRFCIPDSVRRVEAFFRSDDVSKVLTTLKLPKKFDYGFSNEPMQYQRALSKIVFPKEHGLGSAGNCGRFKDCWNLKQIEIPEWTETLTEYAFMNCYALRRIDVPPSVTWIRSAFATGSGLRVISFERHTSVPRCVSDTLYNFPTACKILVPAALYDEWIAAQYWTKVSSQIVPV